MRNVLRALPVFAAAGLLMTLGPAPRAAASDCDDLEDGMPPYGAWVEGTVVGVAEDRVQVGGVTLVVDPVSAPWRRAAARDDGWIESESPRTMRGVIAGLRPGDRIYADGMLAADGTIRLTSIEPDEGVSPDSVPLSGRVTAVSVDDETLTLGGQTVAIEGGGDFWTRYEMWTGLDGIRVGDVVYVDAMRTQDGGLVASEGVYRASGAGTQVRGTIDATDFTDDPRIQVGGVWCVLDGHEAITGLGRDPCDLSGESLDAGWTVRVRGILRDGEIIADVVQVASTRFAKRRGSLRGSGFVNAAEARRVVVNGLGIRRPGRGGAATSARSARPGQRVRFAARSARNGTGDVIATSLRRR